MVDSSYVLALPTSLVLLLHLHILSYPQCNSTECSPETLFARNRPLRERMKIMEDMVAFLLEKIEGKEKCKSILGGTYPCLQPSDTVAFRIHVTKYLETLRNMVTRPGLQVSTSKARIPTSGKTPQTGTLSSKPKPSITGSESGANRNGLTSSSPVAWWWSTIVVRKSLLEECCGDRFERLLLALATHALFIQVPSSSVLHPINAFPPDLTNSFREQSQEYASLFSRTMGLYAGHVQSVSNLNIRTRELISLRNRLKLVHQDDAGGLSTQRLLEIRDFKRREFMDAWQNNSHPGVPRGDGEQSMSASDALKWVSSFVGISTDTVQRGASISSIGTIPSASPLNFLQNLESTTVQNLPTASAYHPTAMHKLRSLPSFVPLHMDLAGDDLVKASDIRSSLTPLSLQELLHHASTQKTALEAALEFAFKARKDISRRLDKRLKTATVVRAPHTNAEGSKQLDLPAPAAETSIFKNMMSSTREPNITDRSRDISESFTTSDEAHPQQRNESSVLNVREFPQPLLPSPSIISNGELSSSQESPHQLTPLSISKKQSGKLPLHSDVPPGNLRPSISSPSIFYADFSHREESPALIKQLSSQLPLVVEVSTPGYAWSPVSNLDCLHQEEPPAITKQLSSQLPVVTEVLTASNSQPFTPSPSISSTDCPHFGTLPQQVTLSALTQEHSDLLQSVTEVSTPSNFRPSIAPPSILGDDSDFEELTKQGTSLTIIKQPSGQVPSVTDVSGNSPIASSCSSDVDDSWSEELPQQLTPLAITKQLSNHLLSTPELSAPSNSKIPSVANISHLIPLTSKIPRLYRTSTPALNRHSKHRCQRVIRSRGSDADVALFTPTNSHDVSALRTDSMTSRRQALVADMSLPDFSVSDIADLDILPSQELDISKKKQRREPVAEPEQTDMPYEGHSITLRDILLKAGNEDSFHLIDGLQDVDEGLGDETIVWG